METSKKIRTAFIAGLTAAALDISAAIIFYAFILDLTTAERVLQSVASGAFGKAAYAGGWQMALVGLAFHTFIALCFAFFYVLIFPLYKKMIPNPWVAGLIYGCFVWCVMNLVVLHLILEKKISTKYLIEDIAIIIIMVGIPIALITNKYLGKERNRD